MPHSSKEIDLLFRVGTGEVIGHVFDNPHHVPIVVYQEPDDMFDDADIKQVQDEFAFMYETPHVYIGRVHPHDATVKASRMLLENLEVMS
jgi:hypothetical protein